LLHENEALLRNLGIRMNGYRSVYI